jgi:transcriptional regulator with AAA-type ATPase domain/tetratricopeptide (TPR) repeat protein
VTSLDELLGESLPIAAVREQARRVLARQLDGARRQPPVLVLGETGTGKGLLAAILHRTSRRRLAPFVDVNCAAIPETLLEAELFGWERGAFTDARQAKPGLFQAAHGGTIFLDEIGLMPMVLQAKLLKVIDEQTVRRLGSTRPEAIDIWVIAATSENLAAAIRARRFREDLYHRLAVVTLALPPLRERGDDIDRLAAHFLARACEDYGLAARTLSAGASAALRAHAWPGNVRELANVMERAALLCEGPSVTVEALDLPAAPAGRAGMGGPGPATTDEADPAERARLLEALQQEDWNFSRAAVRLGLPRNTLRSRLQRLGLAPDHGDPRPRSRGGRPRRRAPSPSVQPPAARPSPPAAAAGMAWESRRLTFVRVSLVSPRPDPPSSETTRTLEAVVDKLRVFGGRVEELTGTGVVATFGLDTAENAPERAAHAATVVRRLTARARDADPARPAARLVVHTDQLVVGRLGERKEIDADGRRAALAVLDAALAAAGPGAILATSAAATFLARGFILATAGTAEGAGPLHRIVGRAEAAALTRFVGREAELRLLHERFSQARAGQGQVVLLVGEPGIGKSRLLVEFRRQLAEAASWMEGQAVSFGRALPFYPLIDMLRRSFHIDEGEVDAAVVAKLEAGVLPLGEDLHGILPFLRHLLSVDPGDPAVATMDPKLRRIETVQATLHLLERVAAQRPLVVVVEDLHWVDEATEEWLARLADGVTAAPIVLVLTSRPGYTPAFADRPFHTRLALGTLSSADSLGLAAGLLGADALPRAVQTLILDKAEGNPFFLEELVRALVESGALRREGEMPSLAIGADRIVVPDTVQDVLAARLERLEAPARTLVQTAAVIGREFTRRLLDRVLDTPRPTEQLLGELKALDLIRDKSRFPETVYVFKHALVQEVAYTTLAADRRRSLHGRIGRVLEELHAERLAEHAGTLAHHVSRAEDWPRALAFLLRAAELAAAAFATRQALVLYDEALEASRRQPSGVDVAAAMSIHEAKAALYIVVSEFARSRAEAERLRELAGQAGDRAREGAALAAIAWAATWHRDLDGAVAHARRAIEVAAPVRAETALARAHFTIGFVRGVTGGLEEAKAEIDKSLVTSRSARDLVYQSLSLSTAGLMKSWEGEFVEAARLQDEGLAIAREHGLLLPLLFSRFLHGLTLTGQGAYAGALATFEEGLALAEKVGDEAIHHRLLNCLGWVHMELGQLARARDLNQRSAEVGRRRNDPGTLPNAELNLGDIFLAEGDLAQAADLFESVQAFARAPGSEWMRFRYSIRLQSSLGELALARGDLARAREHADRCLEAATRTASRKNLVKGWRLAGAIATAARRWDDAETALRQALAIARRIGNPPQLWQTHAALARLHAARGRPDEALAARVAARAVLDRTKAALPDEALRAAFERAPVIRRVYAD